MEQLSSLMPEFWEGFRVTLLLLAVSGVSALILGTLIAAMRISPGRRAARRSPRSGPRSRATRR